MTYTDPAEEKSTTARHPILVALLETDVGALRIAIAIGAMLFGTGLLVTGVGADSAAYALMYYLAPPWLWATAFFSYAAGKIYIAVRWPSAVSRIFSIVVITLGLFLWMYVYFSFIADGQSPAEYMMASLIICEIWIGAHTMLGGERG